MEKFSVEKEFKSEIDEIWNNKIFKEIEPINRGYAVQDEIIKETILFIGINPSFSGELKYGSHFYNNHQEEKMYPYFKKFQDISKKTEIPWSHIDLIYLRETNQKKIVDLFKSENGKNFILEQLKVSKKIIEKSQPKVIVVSNTFARDLLKYINLKFEFDEEIGTHKIIEHPSLKEIPVFFTSMLTGQRALDLGSYQRLVWHIKKVLRK